MDWDRLRLTVPTAENGYADTEVPLETALAGLVQKTDGDPKPFVVWLYRGFQSKANDACDGHLRRDEEASLTLRMFRRYRVNVETLRSDSLRERYAHTPAYVFFDPSGTEISRVEGDRAADCPSVETAMEKAWRATYKTRRRQYLEAMDDVLDEKDKIEARRAELESSRNRLLDRPNPRKSAALDREEKEIESDLEEILETEREAISKVALREEFAPETDDGTARR